MNRSILAFSLSIPLISAACAAGSPPGFSDGDRWSAPLVAPLENGLLLVPVKINGGGPYLFMIDPDSPVTSIDAAIRSEHDLYGGWQAEESLTEADVGVKVMLAEVRSIEVGDLRVSNRTVRVHPVDTYWVRGRRVRGILGRDVVADSLVFAYDRERGMMYLATQGHYDAPPGAKELSWRNFHHKKLTRVNINNDHSVLMHVDLGATTSLLRPERWRDAKLPVLPVQAQLIDELGYSRQVEQGALAAMVQAGDVRVDGVLMLPFADKRFRDTDLDGALGHNFFATFNVVANWHRKKAWLQQRPLDPSELTGERLARWGNTFAGCDQPACVTLTLTGASAPVTPTPPATDSEAVDAEQTPAVDGGGTGAGEGAPAPTDPPQEEPAAPHEEPAAPVEPPAATPPAPSQPPSLTVTRDASVADISYEVLIEAVDAEGKPVGLPRLAVTLPKGLPAVSEPNLDEGYAAAASFRVLDVSPFPRPCQDTGGAPRCIWPVIDRL